MKLYEVKEILDAEVFVRRRQIGSRGFLVPVVLI